MMHANGISYAGDVLDLAMVQKLIVRSGAWFRCGDLQLAQGREKTRQYLVDHPEFTADIRAKVLQAGIDGLAVPAEREAGDDDEGSPDEE